MEDPAQILTATKAFKLHHGQARKEDQTPYLLSQSSVMPSPIVYAGPNGPDLTKVATQSTAIKHRMCPNDADTHKQGKPDFCKLNLARPAPGSMHRLTSLIAVLSLSS